MQQVGERIVRRNVRLHPRYRRFETGRSAAYPLGRTASGRRVVGHQDIDDRCHPAFFFGGNFAARDKFDDLAKHAPRRAARQAVVIKDVSRHGRRNEYRALFGVRAQLSAGDEDVDRDALIDAEVDIEKLKYHLRRRPPPNRGLCGVIAVRTVAAKIYPRGRAVYDRVRAHSRSAVDAGAVVGRRIASRHRQSARVPSDAVAEKDLDLTRDGRRPLAAFADERRALLFAASAHDGGQAVLGIFFAEFKGERLAGARRHAQVVPPLEAVVKDDFAYDLAVFGKFSRQRKRVAVPAVGGVAIGALVLARGTSAKCDHAHQHQNCRCQKSLHLNRCRRIARTLRAIFAWIRSR